MRSFLFVAASMIAVSRTAHGQQFIQTNQQQETYVSDGQINQYKGQLMNSSKTRTKLGAYVEEHEYEHVVEKIIDVPTKFSKLSNKEKAIHIRELADEIVRLQETDTVPILTESVSNQDIYGCTDRLNTTDPGEVGLFFPVFTGEITPENPTVTFEGICFSQISLTFNQTSDSSFDIIADLSGRRSMLCKDALLFANTEIRHFEIFFKGGQHKMSFNMPYETWQRDVAYGGMKAYMICESVKEEIESVMRTLQIFFDFESQNSTDTTGLTELQEANIHFLNVSMGYDLQPRPINAVDIDESMIKSGDHFGIFWLTGTSSFIMYGSGSYIDHSVMALWFEDGLYIVESNTPVIKRSRYADWIRGHVHAFVAWNPLSEEKAAAFNEEAAREFFFQMEGTVYGFHNFMFGWLDTAEDNWPPVVPQHLVPIVMSMIELEDKSMTDVVFADALNKRLGVTGLNITELAALAADQQMSVDDVIGMTEEEGWIYSGLEPKDGRAYVCSAFVTALWKVGGLFDGFEINAPEFTPGDAYRMKFFDTSSRPQQCIDADPDLDFCQLRGDYRMKLPGYNTIEPYSHMNENCPTIAPDYFRPDGC